MKIILCGYMGSGKTSVGKLISKLLQVDFVDLDQVIEKSQEMDLSTVFREKGEIYFRKIENESLQNVLLSPKNRVISLGGGTPCYGNNLELIKSGKTFLVYLKMNVQDLTARLFKEKASRPMIAHYTDKKELEEFIRKHLFERGYFYQQSDLVVEVGEKTPENLAKEIIAALN